MAEEQFQAFASVWIDGKPMADFDDRVRRLEITQRTREASSFRLLLSLNPSDDDAWPLLDDERFELMRRVTLALGIGPYKSDEPETLDPVLDGYITSLEPYFGPLRVPDSVLEVCGLDASCLMHFEARTREWTEQTDAEIVRTIYESYGFAVDIADTAPVRHADTASMLQRCTDAEFVRQLARRNGFECFVEPAEVDVAESDHPGQAVVGHFHAPRLDLDPQEPLTLMPEAHPSLIDLRARWDSHRPTSILSRHIDPGSRRIQTANPKAPSLTQQGKQIRKDLLADKLGRLARKATLDPVGLQHSGVPHHQSELDAFAAADQQESDWLAEATARVQGLRYGQVVKARRPVGIQGCGKLLDGPWYVRGANHRWQQDSSTQVYEVDLELARNALGPSDEQGAG